MPFAVCSGYLQGMAGFYLPAFRKGSHFIIRIQTFHGKELAVIRQQAATPANQVLQRGKGATADLAERLFRLAVFGPAVDDVNVGQAQFQHTLVEEPGFLAIAVEQGKALVREHNGQKSEEHTSELQSRP